MGECWGEGTATFMILGNICTRSCGFCNVATGRPLAVDWDEPDRVARSIQRMKIKHAVLTSVDRDDLPDGGSIIWAETIQAVRRLSAGTTMETLIPDFRGITDQIDRIVGAAPEVVSHNLETVRRLTRQVRVQAQYDRSLEVLRYLKAQGVNRTKTGIMLGLGDTETLVRWAWTSLPWGSICSLHRITCPFSALWNPKSSIASVNSPKPLGFAMWRAVRSFVHRTTPRGMCTKTFLPYF